MLHTVQITKNKMHINPHNALYCCYPGISLCYRYQVLAIIILSTANWSLFQNSVINLISFKLKDQACNQIDFVPNIQVCSSESNF